jgi:O-Antigen ligase
VSWLVVGLFVPAIVVAAFVVWLRPVFALYGLAVGLVLHNTVFLLLFAAGARGWQLTLAQSWKEILLAVALLSVYRAGRLPFRPGAVDAAALLFAVAVAVYALIPQHALGGQAGLRAELYGARHFLIAVAAYFLGRGLAPSRDELRRLGLVILGIAAVGAVVGIAEEYLVSVENWRSLGAARYFHQQLDFPRTFGPGGLPENFVLNTTDGVYRRLVSFFLSPLGSAHLFVLAICLVAAGALGSRRLVRVAGVIAFAGLLFSFSRSALVALVAALGLLGAVERRAVVALLGLVVLAAIVGFAALFTSIAPKTHFLRSDLAAQRALNAKAHHRPPGANPLHSTVTFSESSEGEHWGELKHGARSLLDHPQGYGVGNSGATARRFGVPLRAGESFYLEVGADTGIVGLALWLAFTMLVLQELLVRARAEPLAAGLFAAGAALAAMALISDVWGGPWPAYLLWALSGAVLTVVPRRTEEPQLRPKLATA